MTEFKETAYNQTSDSKTAQISTNERAWINKLLKLAEKHPDEVQITEHPDSNQGYLVADVPKRWFRITPTSKRVMTEEQRAAAAERMRKLRQNLDK